MRNMDAIRTYTASATVTVANPQLFFASLLNFSMCGRMAASEIGVRITECIYRKVFVSSNSRLLPFQISCLRKPQMYSTLIQHRVFDSIFFSIEFL